MIQELIRKTKGFLFGRQQAYIVTFTGVPQEEVLADLASFCRANESTFHPDPRVAANLDGRREVWLRITQHLNLTQEQLWKLYGRPDLDK